MFVTLAETKKTWEECKTKYEKIIFLIKNIHLMDKESKAYKSGEFHDIFEEAELNPQFVHDIIGLPLDEIKRLK